MSRPTSVADWLQWQESLNPRSIDMGLDRMRTVLARLGVKPPPGRVLTVGGTNGKGSTITLLHDCLRAGGGHPGLYTSPHLVHYQERIQTHGQPIADHALLRAFARVEDARGSVQLTYYEFGTLAALVCFDAAACDTWLLEVGLGGRLDAVNALDADIALITTIGLDHQEWLGQTIEAIAAEKAGILRRGKVAFFGDTPVPKALHTQAARVGATLATYGQDFSYGREPSSGEWFWQGEAQRLNGLQAPPDWTGAQFRNASLTLAALTHLGSPVPLTKEFLNPVLLASRPPGRFQKIQRDQEWILDVAHNPQAAAVLRAQLATEPRPPGGPEGVTGVVALLADKAAAEFIATLAPAVGRWVVTRVDDPRASSECRMREALATAGVREFTWVEDPRAAFEKARQVTVSGGRIVVCGSFRIVAPALQWLGLY